MDNTHLVFDNCPVDALFMLHNHTKDNKKESLITLGDKRIGEYEFLTNYYFMAGDYVPDSRDSRYWGLLPEDHIVGQAYIVWRSKDPYEY